MSGNERHGEVVFDECGLWRGVRERREGEEKGKHCGRERLEHFRYRSDSIKRVYVFVVLVAR